jgi:hypothetical protein
LDDVLSQSFSREFEALFTVRHLCVIPLYGFWRGRESAIAMKYMESSSLCHVMARVDKGDRPEFWNPIWIAIMICGIIYGMEFIHLAGFVH